tara:strand:+ start:67 stop:480 length:414 start_codon:yes stop_codon:yes gene_type:complete
MTKQARGDYPFGSTMWRNLPRANFQVKADRSDADVAISLRNTKQNNRRRLKPLGYKFHFDDASVTVSMAQPLDYPDLAQDTPLKDRITEALSRGQMSAEDIAQELDESRDTVRRTLNRNKNNFQKLGTEWGISYRQA